MKVSVLIISIAVVVGLLVVNIMLVNRASEAEETMELYKMKFETQQGDVDLLTYDLVTARDSVRIVNKELNSCLHSNSITEE